MVTTKSSILTVHGRIKSRSIRQELGRHIETFIQGTLEIEFPGIVIGDGLVAEARQHFRNRLPFRCRRNLHGAQDGKVDVVGGEAVPQGKVQRLDQHGATADEQSIRKEPDLIHFLQELGDLGGERVPVQAAQPPLPG